MDSDALLTFLTIYRRGGFSAAAEALHRSQPAISRRMALLESELGAPLFERVTGGAVLSQAGRTLLPHAERVMAALKDAGDAVGAHRAGDGGPLALAVVGTLANTGLTQVLKRFAASSPGIGLTLRTASSAEVSELVRSGTATVGLRYFDDPSADLDCLPLKPERLAVACAPDHPRAGKRVRSLGELQHQHWLAFPQARGAGEPTAQTLFMQFQMRGIVQFGWTPVDSLTAQKRLIEAGFGIALLPESAIAEERKAKTLSVIRVDDLDADNPVTVITRKGGYLSSAAERLVGILKSDYRA